MRNSSHNSTYYCTSLQPVVVYNFNEIKSAWPVPFWFMWPAVDTSVEWLLLAWFGVAIASSFNTEINDTHDEKNFRTCARLGDPGNAKNENWFFIFLKILPKHVRMGWKVHETLKSSIRFIVEHIFTWTWHIS